MGLISELNYEVRSANAFQRITQKLASSKPGAWVFQRSLHPIDNGLFKLTKGKVTVAGVMAGLPVIVLTTTGAKTGKLRTMPLLGIPTGDDMAVIGSNFGQTSTPGWVHNLRAHPEATVSYGSAMVDARARRATEAEANAAFNAGAAFYGGFPKYRERASHRHIEVFVLQPR